MDSIRTDLADFVAKLQKGMSQTKFLALLAILVGVVAGFAAAMLKDLINYLSKFVKGIFPADEFNWLFLIVPLIGIVLCGIYCRYVVKEDMEFGCERILRTLKAGKYRLKRSLSYAPIIACSLTIGFGGSAGSEGPIAYAGAGIGSNIGKFLRLDDEIIRVFVIIGAAAGIAGIFKAPVGGAMFALEVLAMPLTTAYVVALMFACVSASCVAYAFSGFTIDVTQVTKGFYDPRMTLGVVVLGLICALYSTYYTYSMSKTEKFMTRFNNPWIKNLVSGAMVGALIFIFPVLYGEGYGVIDHVINGNNSDVMRDTLFFNVKGNWMLLIFVVGTLLVKSIAVAATNSGGGVGGDFTPTLFAGSLIGLVFAHFSNLFLGTHFDEVNFVLFGMAGVMAGAIQAPLMAMFITLEMVGDFAMFFPLTICAFLSFAFTRLMHKRLNLRPSWRHRIETLIEEVVDRKKENSTISNDSTTISNNNNNNS